MEKFNESYYKNIWGTVHRHDYCECLADWFISRFKRCRILDIGCGCGELVRLLRHKGCDAWGLEVSNYALTHSCCKSFVKRGSITNIPFASGSFDVVHSQGVFGYVEEHEVAQAWQECKRVGKIQQHNIDYNDDTPEHQYLIIKPKEWWDEKLR